MLNSVHIIGRLGRDPELRYTSSGTPICNLRVATDESYTDRDGNKVDRVEWHTVVVFNKPAEACANHLGKGSLVFVDGSLQTRKWQDASGQDRYSTEIKAQRVQFLDRRGEAQPASEPATGRAQAPSGSGAARQQQPASAREAFPGDAGGMDDVPF